ncbi:MAG TPA: peptidylprolyl isomerase [Candidatus Saccharimonadales bacterium]|jgi:hypothetical protein
MKKLINKVRKQPAERPGRITNETVAAHREQILAGGRKFKYPVQYARHRLVLNTIAIAAITVLVLSGLTWYLLYQAQTTSKFMYRVTQLVPLPVARVDGEPVPYSEYLKKYRSDIHSLVQQEQINLNSADGKRQSNYYKRRELDAAVRDAYVTKLARQEGVSISLAKVDDFITQTVSSKSISLQAYERTVLNNFYDWSLDEYRGVVKARLLSREVNFKIDTAAKAKADDLARKAVSGADFAQLAKDNSDDMATKPGGGDAGTLPLDNQDPNGLVAAARKMNPGQVTGPIQGSDGWYVIKLIEKNDTSVHYALIKVALTELDKRFDAVKKAGKVDEYIKVDKI